MAEIRYKRICREGIVGRGKGLNHPRGMDVVRVLGAVVNINPRLRPACETTWARFDKIKAQGI